ncbi:MAG: hypothetical protein ACXVPN_06325 [Bacteroidia bacterium]
MATGIIKDLFPTGNDGSADGAARVTDDVSGQDYVFFTPDNVPSSTVPLAAGAKVSFDISGDTADNIQKIS